MAKEKFAAPYKEMAQRWQRYYTSPGRPSKDAIKAYREFTLKAIKGLKGKLKVLILGSTPELRDLAYELGLEVAIIDINLEMILAMSKITRHQDKNEIIVKADWALNPLKSKYFDLVFGDLSTSNVPLEKQPAFLKNLCRLLKPGGYYINKVHVVPDNWKVESFEKAVSRYLKPASRKNTHMELLCYLLNNTFDAKRSNVGLSKIRMWMDKYKVKPGVYRHNSPKITRYFNLIWKMWQPMDKQWSIMRRNDEVKQLSPYFKLVEEIVLKDCINPIVDQQFPVWSLKKI